MGIFANKLGILAKKYFHGMYEKKIKMIGKIYLLGGGDLESPH